MKPIAIILLACALVLAGCSVTSERIAQAESALEQAEIRAAQAASALEAAVSMVASLEASLESLRNQDIMDPKVASAIGMMEGKLESARTAIPKIQEIVSTASSEVTEIRGVVTDLKAQAESLGGQVPWYYVVGAFLLNYAPRVAATFFPPLAPLAAAMANFNWRAQAIPKQLEVDEQLYAAAGVKS